MNHYIHKSQIRSYMEDHGLQGELIQDQNLWLAQHRNHPQWIDPDGNSYVLIDYDSASACYIIGLNIGNSYTE